MKTLMISKGLLKARMSDYFDRVEKEKNVLIVTSHNKPVLTVQPIDAKRSVSEVL